EIELKIPQKHIGQVRKAFLKAQENADGVRELDVDFLVRADPAHTYKGKLREDRLGVEANPNKEDASESEPTVLAYVRIEGTGIAKDDQVSRHLLVAGTEVHAKVRCGDRALGYSLFYGVWEFFYEKVVFFF